MKKNAAHGMDAEALAALGYRSAADVERTPFNFATAAGDVGAILDAAEARDMDRVPVVLVRAGEGWAAIVRPEDFLMLRNLRDETAKPRK